MPTVRQIRYGKNSKPPVKPIVEDAPPTDPAPHPVSLDPQGGRRRTHKKRSLKRKTRRHRR